MRNQRLAARILGHVRGLYLGQHAAAAETAHAFRYRQIGRDIAQFFDQLRARFGRVFVVQTINLRQNHQHVRLHHLGDFRG